MQETMLYRRIGRYPPYAPLRHDGSCKCLAGKLPHDRMNVRLGRMKAHPARMKLRTAPGNVRPQRMNVRPEKTSLPSPCTKVHPSLANVPTPLAKLRPLQRRLHPPPAKARRGGQVRAARTSGSPCQHLNIDALECMFLATSHPRAHRKEKTDEEEDEEAQPES